MPRMNDRREFRNLWEAWNGTCAAAPTEPPAEALRAVLAARGTRLSADELRLALEAAGPMQTLTPDRFVDALAPVLGGSDLRLELAFAHVAAGARTATVETLRAALAPLFDDAAALTAMLEELDADGDRAVTLCDFIAFHPGADDAGQGYRASHVHPSRIGASTAPAPQPSAAAIVTPPQAARPASDDADGISPLQMQIGFFRLLQGAAYRSFRESYSANSESHLRARDLPYAVENFAEFVDAAVDLHLSLGLVSGGAARAEFHALSDMVAAENAALTQRIENWDALDKTAAMVEAEAQLERELAESKDNRARFAEAVEYLLTLRQHGLAPGDAAAGALARHEINRLRHMELQAERGHAPAPAGAPMPYHDAWNPVLPTADGARPRGAVMPTAFWYDRFQPQLLRCASILSDEDLTAANAPDVAALDRWHADTVAAGRFDAYATDLRDGFAACSPSVKQSMRQAWRLTEHYLNGLEKRREREEFGRETGFLSQYVAFVDVHLGRSDIADAEMRLSFPYYIGPAAWCYMHTAAELIEAMAETPREAAIAAFKRFFRALATMYPCPYCRYHLNRYVAPNRETWFYPIEFLMLGQRPDREPFAVTLDDRLETIAADRPGSMRLFVWKLHNAVSSSIARTEEWYHRDALPLYTTRFWPGFDAEIARARCFGRDRVAVDELAQVYGVVKASVPLATLRDETQIALKRGDRDLLDEAFHRAADQIVVLEEAMERSGLLQRLYRYDASKVDASPTVSEAGEAFARCGMFIER